MLPDASTFESIVETVKERGVYILGKVLLDQIICLLQERRATLDAISTLEEQGKGKANFGITPDECLGFRHEVALFFPVDFLDEMTGGRLVNIPRYLKAMVLRLSRKLQDPAKDQRKMAEVQPFIDLFDGGMQGEPYPLKQKWDLQSFMI